MLAYGFWSYPLIVVGWAHVTWFLAWVSLGRRPRVSLDDPNGIASPLVRCAYMIWNLLLDSMPLVGVGTFGITILFLAVVRPSLAATARGLALVLLGWLASGVALAWSPWPVAEWILD